MYVLRMLVNTRTTTWGSSWVWKKIQICQFYYFSKPWIFITLKLSEWNQRKNFLQLTFLNDKLLLFCIGKSLAKLKYNSSLFLCLILRTITIILWNWTIIWMILIYSFIVLHEKKITFIEYDVWFLCHVWEFQLFANSIQYSWNLNEITPNQTIPNNV